MKRKSAITRYASIFLVLLLLLPSCTDEFSALNTPSNQIVADQVDAGLLGQAFAQSQFVGMYGSPGPFQITQALFADLYAQYFATTAENFDSDQFVEVGRWIDSAWNNFYATAAPQIHFVVQFSEEQGLDIQNAIAKVWKVQLFHRITDYWGPIIYSEFGNGATSVAYDAQEDIYRSFFTTLDEAVAVLQQNSGGNAFSSNDQIYGGNVDQWLTFANSLRLRLAMRVKYVDPALARQEAEKAVSAGVMQSNAANASVLTTPNSRNPYTTITDWGEFRMSSAMESLLEGYEDPRLGVYFSPAVDGDTDGDAMPYEGMRNGLPRIQKGPVLNPQYSDMGVDWLNDGRGGSNPPIKVMNASEVYFLRAEGALEGWSMDGSVEQLYNEGIRMSLSEDRIGALGAEIDAYVSSSNLPISPEDEWSSPPMTDIPVAFDAGGSQERQLEQIITQKWLALYPDSWEAYSEHRRTGYPRLYPIINSANPDIPPNGVFRRMTFVDSEFSNNRAAVEAAVSLLPGPDRNDTRVWWDAR